MNFRDLIASTDSAVLESCGDPAVLDGRPVRILYCDQGEDPRIGRLRTNITEPMAYLPAVDAGVAAEGSLLSFGELEYDVVRVEQDGTGWVGLVLRPTS